MTGDRMSAEPVGDERVDTGARQRSWVPRLVPNTVLGWSLAAISVLILGVGVYAAAEPVREFYRQGLPATVETGSDKKPELNLGTRPDENLSVLRTELDQTKTQDGVRLTLDWAYAEERYVAVGLHTQRLDGSGETRRDGALAFTLSLWDDTVGNEAEFPPYVQITDASGQDFDTVGGGTLLGPGRTGADATFDAPEGLEPSRGHRFRLEVPLVEEPVLQKDAPGEKPDKAGPFVFVFEVPVRPAPTIEVDRRVEVEGIPLTLKRVVDSPVMPQAVVCFKPPDDNHDWMPSLKDNGSYPKVGSAPQQLGDGCWMLGMPAAIEGPSSVTVANLEGMPRDVAPNPSGRIDPKTIRGPWTFEFRAPDR